MMPIALSSLFLTLFPYSSGEPVPFPASSSVEGSTAVKGLSLLLMERFVSDDAEPAEEQPGLALEFDSYVPGSFGWEIGLSYSSDEEDVSTFLGSGDFEVTLTELYAGGRKTFGDRNLHPYVAGGVSFLQAEVDLDISGVGSADEDDTSFGLYARGGAYWTLGQRFRIGADLKGVFGTDFDDLGGDADYYQVGLLAGYSF